MIRILLQCTEEVFFLLVRIVSGLACLISNFISLVFAHGSRLTVLIDQTGLRASSHSECVSERTRFCKSHIAAEHVAPP